MEKNTKLNLNHARDEMLFRQPKITGRNEYQNQVTHTGEEVETALMWRYDNEDEIKHQQGRVMVLPEEFRSYLERMGMAREVLGAITKIFITRKSLESNTINVKLADIRNILDLQNNGTINQKIRDCLLFLRAYTIKNYTLFIEDKSKRTSKTKHFYGGKITFGFLSQIHDVTTEKTIVLEDGTEVANELPVNKRYLRIVFSPAYATLLRENPKLYTIPVIPQELKKNIHPRYIQSVKNLIAYFSTVSKPVWNLTVENIMFKCEIKDSRKRRWRGKAETILNYLQDLGYIQSFLFRENEGLGVFRIILKKED